MQSIIKACPYGKKKSPIEFNRDGINVFPQRLNSVLEKLLSIFIEFNRE